MFEPDSLLEMQYEEQQAPTLYDYDDYWVDQREAQDYEDEWPRDGEA